MEIPTVHPARVPSRALSVVIFAIAVALVAVLRFHVFRDDFIPLASGLPLLVCLWHRDRWLLWSMALALTVMAAAKTFFVVPDAVYYETAKVVQWLVQVINIVVIAGAVHAILELTGQLYARNAQLEAANEELAARQKEISRQNDELQAQSEELAQQNEELQQQAEELQRQSEELEQQMEELQAQAEELRVTNEELNRRESMLSKILVSLQDTSDERQLMQRICESMLSLLGGSASAVAVVEQVGDELVLHAHAGAGAFGRQRWPVAQSFAAVVMQHNRTGFVDDLSARPDLVVPQPQGRPFRSILATPLRLDSAPIGAVKVYADEPRRWNAEDFRIAEWVAGQCEMILQIVRSKEAERDRAEELEKLMDVAPVAIWVSRDPECRQIVGNRLANEFYEARDNENVSPAGSPQVRRFFKQGRELRADELPMQVAARENRNVVGEELEVLMPSGRRIIMLGSATPLRDEQGRVRGCLGAFLDVTRRKQAERQLEEWSRTLERRVAERTAEAACRAKQLQRLAGELTQAEQRERQRLATILHDGLQQLLVGAKFHVDIVRSQATDARVREGLGDVDKLLDESLKTSRSLTAELSPPILREGTFMQVLHWLARWAKEKHALTVEVRGDERVDPQDHGVRILLFQAIRELLLNVRKHAKVDSACIHVRRDGGQIEIIVADDGVGFVPDGARPHASDGQGDGSGFGLFSIAERLELLAGRLEVTSRPGGGTRVRLIAPLEASAPQGTSLVPLLPISAGEKTLPCESDGQKIRVLLVDDHAVVRDGLARLLGMQPDIAVVGQAEDGIEAVERALQLRPDVILMDVSMPNLGGVEATRRILRDLPATRIIGLSMHAQEDVAAQMTAAGAAAYLTKTSQPPKLLAAIRQCGCRE